jgi:uncharacterized membrane protein YhaH (DUF805 family)
MSFTQAIRSGFANYVNFRGRAMPSEFWWWQLFMLLAAIAAAVLDALFGFERIGLAELCSFATLLPSLAVAVRRLHDIDKSGWWFLMMLIPLVGIVMLIIWWIGEGTPGYNRFGANPKPKEVSLHAQGRSLHRGRTDTTN